MLICAGCGKQYEYVRGKGCTKKGCLSCTTKKRRVRLKQEAVAFLGGKCNRCGYSKSIHALQFHHLDKALKSFTISANYCRAWSKTKKELEKCELVCANCHSEIEYGIQACVSG